VFGEIAPGLACVPFECDSLYGNAVAPRNPYPTLATIAVRRPAQNKRGAPEGRPDCREK
jgi:hypothetical protein